MGGLPFTAEELRARLDRAFNPRAVAVVGDKRANGFLWLTSMRTFQGPLYSVQIDPQEAAAITAMGIPNYSSLREVPGPVDYVVCAVPRQVAPRIVADCAETGVTAVALFTSGFAETEQEEGIRLQWEIGEIARRAGLLLIGPNCMGIYNPRLGVRHSAEQEVYGDGRVAFISQSGTHCINFSLVGYLHGVRCSKTVSVGNCEVLDIADYLDYFLHDPETEVIAMYVEGPRDGRRFFQVLKEAARRKPVVVWKGGVTDPGARAVYSHTASLATAPQVWRAAMRQAGAIEAETLEETIDVVKALLYTRPVTGRRMGLIAMTGGQSVVITDAFAREGLEVPLLTPSSYQRLASFFNVIGGSYRNPLDAGGTVAMGFAVDNVRRLLEVLDADENVDAIAFEVGTGFLVRRIRHDPSLLDSLAEALAAFKESSPKALVTVVHPGHAEEVSAQIRARFLERGLPVFATFGQAARALRRAIDYWRFRQEQGA
ncbi:MAG: CoA-binding protein [Dehalococcoidia bacterium]|jgi:acyl-CoA synthetase (NDP forming)|nr:CoA-binding protein [Dehalococcoidia bacterium]MDW8009266.1 CoA-binding protein [Chloroflexota bacterium]